MQIQTLLAHAILSCRLLAAGPCGARQDDPLADALLAQRQAEARRAEAEAERAEWLARTPPATRKAEDGAADIAQFGSAGLVRAFDLAQELAGELCAQLPAGQPVVLHDPAASQGVLAARTVNAGITQLADELARQNRELQAYIDAHTPPGSAAAALPLAALALVPATVRAAADIGALWNSDVSARGIGYGEGARNLFASALAQACPERVVGLGAGYLGELDLAQHERLLARVRSLATQRADYARRLATLERLANAAKGDEKRDMGAMADSASALLRQADAFIDSLRAGETGERSPLFVAARYLGYAGRTAGAAILDADLRLEGLAMVKDSLFGGQRVRLSGVAFLWYRLHDANGVLRHARTLRRITPPVEIDLRTAAAPGELWNGPRR